MANLLVLGRMLGFVSRAKSSSLIIIRRSQRAFIAAVALVDLVRLVLAPASSCAKQQPASIKAPRAPAHRILRQSPSPSFRSAYAPTVLQAGFIYRLCLKQSTLLNQVPRTLEHGSAMTCAATDASCAGDVSRGSSLVAQVQQKRISGFNAAALQPLCEAIVSVLIVAGFCISAGDLRFYACLRDV